MALNDYTDGNVLSATNLENDSSFLNTKINDVVGNVHFTNGIIPSDFESSTQFSTNSTCWEIVLNSPTGQNVNKVAISLSGAIAFSSLPVLKLQYSTDNSSWSDWTTPYLPTGSSSQQMFQAYGVKTDFASTTIYIRLKNESNACSLAIGDCVVNYQTSEGRTFTAYGQNVAFGTSDALLADSIGSFNTATVYHSVVPFFAPTGRTIKSCSAWGYVSIATTGDDVVNKIRYSNNNSSWNDMGTSNTYTTGATVNDVGSGLYGIKTGLSESVLYIGVESVRSATSTSSYVLRGNLFCFVCFE